MSKIPKNCVRIGRHDSANMTAGAEVWFDSDMKEFYIKADSWDSDGDEKTTIGGPFNINDLELLKEVIADIVTMKGRYGAV